MEQKLKGKDKGFKVKTFVNNSVRLNTDYKFWFFIYFNLILFKFNIIYMTIIICLN